MLQTRCASCEEMSLKARIMFIATKAQVWSPQLFVHHTCHLLLRKGNHDQHRSAQKGVSSLRCIVFLGKKIGSSLMRKWHRPRW